MPGESPLTENERQHIRTLLLIGGYSFNSGKGSDEESRRVELKLEFWGLDEKGKAPSQAYAEINGAPLGQCRLERHAVAN